MFLFYNVFAKIRQNADNAKNKPNFFNILQLGGVDVQGDSYKYSVFRPSDAEYAEMDIRLCLHQSLTTSDDGGSRGADVVDDEEMLSVEGEMGGRFFGR